MLEIMSLKIKLITVVKSKWCFSLQCLQTPHFYEPKFCAEHVNLLPDEKFFD